MNEVGVGLGGGGLSLGGSSPEKVQDRRLREASQQFEGMLLGIMMKEALRDTLTETSEGAGAGLNSFKEFCIEQVANSMAESSSLGIADQLYADLGIEGARHE